jgi:two-component system sensor histidine kinase KdpD
MTGFGALFVIGTFAAGLHGRFSAAGVLIAAAAVVGVMSFVGEMLAAVPLGVIGWLTAVGFSGPPYAELRPSGPLAAHAAVVMAVSVLAGAAGGQLCRWWAARYILVTVVRPLLSGRRDGNGLVGGEELAGRLTSDPGPATASAADPIDARRRLAGVVLAVVGLPLLTLVLAVVRHRLSLTDDLLIYLLAVVALAVIGGFWPALLAAVAASVLLNWYFTPPLHTWTIDLPQNLLALLLFVAAAVAVSSVVHLAARRSVQAQRSREEAATLLALAQTVLSGPDTPAAVLAHLTRTLGGSAELQEYAGGRWVRIESSGSAGNRLATTHIAVRENLALEVSGQCSDGTPGLLSGFAAQCAAALDRERLRTQAAQAEALAEGNRMRTALLAAVSHDLRTPLASIKAAVSSLRQTDVEWTAADQADLLATIEQNADRLDGLIGNLLDMSRLHTGSLQPFLRSTAVDEVAPVALQGLDTPGNLRLLVPDGLPLLRADPGLLERVLANLFSNALRHSPPSQPPALRARRRGDSVVLQIVDHGRGVPDELKPRIFEPFQRFDDHGTGVGLGLAVAKGFTEAMGGSISAANTPGGGLTISVTLPVAGLKTVSPLGADS